MGLMNLASLQLSPDQLVGQFGVLLLSGVEHAWSRSDANTQKYRYWYSMTIEKVDPGHQPSPISS